MMIFSSGASHFYQGIIGYDIICNIFIGTQIPQWKFNIIFSTNYDITYYILP